MTFENQLLGMIHPSARLFSFAVSNGLFGFADLLLVVVPDRRYCRIRKARRVDFSEQIDQSAQKPENSRSVQRD
jgi:hypothetical protein